MRTRKKRQRGKVVDLIRVCAIAKGILNKDLHDGNAVAELQNLIDRSGGNPDGKELAFIRRMVANPNKRVDVDNIACLASALGFKPDQYEQILRRGPLTNLTIWVPPSFVHQQERLAAIEAAFEKGRSRVTIVAIHGMRGVGKTTLAAAYAQEHWDDYSIIWRIYSETEALLRDSLVALGISAGWTNPTAPDDEALKTVMSRLRTQGQILLIYDSARNADSLRPYLPETGSVQILVTSNSRVWRELATPIELNVWPEAIGAEYLISRSGRRGSAQEAQALSAQLGGLPLALAHAAAFCERREVTLSSYLERFRARPKDGVDDTLADRDNAPADYHSRRTVATTFSLAIEEATAEHPAAGSVMVLAGQFPVVAIPIYVLAQAITALEAPLAATKQPAEVDKVIMILREFALVDRENLTDPNIRDRETEAIRLHSVVREVAYARAQGVRAPARRVLIKVLNSLYTLSVSQDPGRWQTARILDPLAFALLVDDSQEPARETPEMIELAYTTARYRLAAAVRYSEAKPLLERVVRYRERTSGSADLATLDAWTNLAFCMRALGDFAKASAIHQKLIETRSVVQGATHQDTLHEVNLLSFSMLRLGQHDRLETLLQEHIARCEHSVGAQSPETFLARGLLGFCLSEKGDRAGAEEQHRQAYAGLAAILTADHGLVLEAEINWGASLKELGRYEQAQPLLERVSKVAAAKFGMEHEIARSARDQLDSLNRARGRGGCAGADHANQSGSLGATVRPVGD